MFVGHYGAAAAARSSGVKLWHGFVAVQFLDILWAPFILLGVESVRIVPGFTEANALDLHHMPYTHSLAAALFWSVVVAAAWRLLLRKSGALIMGALVFSHWVFDWLVHTPDLPLWPGGPKVGLGLWNTIEYSLPLELGVFIIGYGVYLLRTTGGRLAAAVTLIAGLALQAVANFGPPPASPDEAAISALVAYAVFIALAVWNDATRQLKG